MADSAVGSESFDSTWGPIGRIVAVVSAALVALVGVVAHVPVWLASLRGVATLAAVLVLVRSAGFVASVVQRSRVAKGSETGREDRR